jgi:ankyrin repeat protein
MTMSRRFDLYFLKIRRIVINTADDTSTYQVMWASLEVHDNVVQMLLERGADVDAKGGHYRNALEAACSGRALQDSADAATIWHRSTDTLSAPFQMA